MIKLPIPEIDYSQMLNKLELSMQKSNDKRGRLNSSKVELAELENSYSKLLESLLEPIDEGDGKVIIGSLTSSDLEWLYTDKFQKSNFYQEIRNATNVCPFCLKMDKPKTLDHFLPKSVYSEYSILPLNLVPLCRDCNSGEKGSDKAGSLEEIPIHPYLDDSCFFEHQWVKVEFIQIEEKKGVKYSSHPPCEWSSLNKKRAANFFKSMNLAELFNVRAVPQVMNMQNQMNAMKEANTSSEDIIKIMMGGVNAEESISINHWKVVLLKEMLSQL